MAEGECGALVYGSRAGGGVGVLRGVRGDGFRAGGDQGESDVHGPEGVVYSRGGEVAVEDDVPLPHSLEATVRKWGMPTRLDKGKVVLDQEYVVVEEGKEMDSHQTALLKTFGVAMAEFRVKVVAYWSAATQEITEVDTATVVEMEE